MTAHATGAVAVLFSGGTDSTCVASLLAERYSQVHLLTFYEFGTRKSPSPSKNYLKLAHHHKQVDFIHQRICVDHLVRFFSYERYLSNLLRHRWLVLATPGFSTLSWHLRTIVYCKKMGIDHVADGLTRELIHFPGHMANVIVLFKRLYAHFGIDYSNPVIDWETPTDRQFLDRMVVNTHASEFFLGDQNQVTRKTTGKYLFDKGIMPTSNVKGSALDFSMQHQCYPFTVYNILVFWGILTRFSYATLCSKVERLMIEKIAIGQGLLESYFATSTNSALQPLLQESL